MANRYGRITAVVSGVVLIVAAMIGSGATASSAVPARQASNGMLRVAVVDQPWTTLDPATNANDSVDVDYLSAIYGQLFELGPNNAVVCDEASAYTFSNHNKTVTITIRSGIRFTDGQPLTAADVAWNINRDISPQYGNVADPEFPLASPATSVGNKVVLDLALSDTAIIPAFIGAAPNYTLDKSAFLSEGASLYGSAPIGAGPFKIVTNVPNISLVLTRNPSYWQKGRPLASGVTFRTFGDDQSAVNALRNGSEDIALGVSTISLIKKAPSQGLTVTHLPQVADEFVALNTATTPFNNPLARQAVEAATNQRSLVATLYGGVYTPIQAETGPGQEYYVKNDKHYQGYNLTKARQLVQKLGGLTVSLATSSSNPAMASEVLDLATMWEAAGISVNVLDYSQEQALSITLDGSWQAIDQTWGPNVDPIVNDGQYFRSHWPLSGVADPTLDGMLNQAQGIANASAQARILRTIDDYENQQNYAVWLYARNDVVISTSAVTRNAAISPDLYLVQWENVGRR